MASPQHTEVKLLAPIPKAPGTFRHTTISASDFALTPLAEGLTLFFLSTTEDGKLSHNVQQKLERSFDLPQYWWQKNIHRGQGLYTHSDSTSTFRLFVKQVQPDVWKKGPPKRYTWYEMSFHFFQLDQSRTAIFCFNVPDTLQPRLEDAVRFRGSDDGAQDWFLSGQAMVLHWLLDLYDDSIWAIRDAVREIEKQRERDQDETGLAHFSSWHDVFRHAIHVTETLKVAQDVLESHIANVTKTANVRYQTARGANESGPQGQSRLEALQHLDFSLHRLRALKLRSDSNDARLRNEISLSFNLLAQQDTKAMLAVSSAAKEDSTAMRRVGFITLLFLPATFVSTIFSTTFFNFNPDIQPASQQWRISQSFWIYWVVTVPLTVLTWIAWHYLQRSQDTIKKAQASRSSTWQRMFRSQQRDDAVSLKIIP